MNFIDHPRLVPQTVEHRHYQFNIAQVCMDSSTLVVLPTGMGKTIVALLVVADRLERTKGKVLFMAPTKPLVEQHIRTLNELLAENEEHSACLFTGEVAPAKRKKMWNENRVIVSTPQVIQNDIIGGRIDIRDVSLMIFDEAHRAVGDYAYTFIGERYTNTGVDPLVLGMTASPGSDTEKIVEVCKNLGVQAVEIRSEHDPDVRPYVHHIELEWMRVKMPRMLEEAARILRGMMDDRMKRLSELGYMRRGSRVSMKDLLELQGKLNGMLRRGEGAADGSIYTAISLVAAAMKINHALEMAETQGKEALRLYLERLEGEANSKGSSKAAKAVVYDKKYRRVKDVIKQAADENPKFDKVAQVVLDQLRRAPGSRIIVFTHFRDTATLVTNGLEGLKHPGVKPVRFVGQASHGDDKGLRQKQQVEVVEKFKGGEYNVLVATSVAEEGLDIPATDLVVFFEPVPSEIRLIQRRGRTGRKSLGRVVVMIYQGTKDEAYLFSSQNKEKKMKRQLDKLRRELGVRTSRSGDVDGGREGFVISGDGQVEVVVQESTGPAPDPKGSLDRSLEELAWSDIPGKDKAQTDLSRFGEETVEEMDERDRIIVDNREFRSKVAQELARRDVVVEPMQLQVGDYVISKRLVVERKETDDMVQSLIDGRLFSQATALVRSEYQRRLIIVEGEDVYTVRRMNPEAISGAILSLMLDFQIPIMFTRGPVETADVLLQLLKKETKEKQEHGVRDGKVPMVLHERQRFVVEGLPNISATLAKRLLDHFGSVQAVMDAHEKDLCQVQGIGKGTAREIRELLMANYGGKD